jgi:hypothetical protein
MNDIDRRQSGSDGFVKQLAAHDVAANRDEEALNALIAQSRQQIITAKDWYTVDLSLVSSRQDASEDVSRRPLHGVDHDFGVTATADDDDF